MRKLILIAALGLASCGGSQVANNSAVSEETGAEEIGPVNDTTAIDAATGEAANMAADVNYTFNEETMTAANNSTAKAPSRTAPRPKPAPTNSTAPAATENTTTAATNTTG